MRTTAGVLFCVFTLLLVAILEIGCKKSDSLTGPGQTIQLYKVTATVVDPQGQPVAGAVLRLQSPPIETGTFVTNTDSAGRGTLDSPSGAQTLVARSGLTLEGTVSVSVAANSTPTDAGVIHLAQVQTTISALVIISEAESLQTVLRVVGFTTFDTTYYDTLLAMGKRDSTGLLSYLSRYSIIFSNCTGGFEIDTTYALLSRTYGRYIDGGGTVFGGHYNFYHLRRLWPGYYNNDDRQIGEPRDSIRIVDAALATYLGFTTESWALSTAPSKLSGYEKFSDPPLGSKIYGTISWTNPQVPVIVENYRGKGRFLWTNFHNQDISSSVNLTKIVQYYLLTL